MGVGGLFVCLLGEIGNRERYERERERESVCVCVCVYVVYVKGDVECCNDGREGEKIYRIKRLEKLLFCIFSQL